MNNETRTLECRQDHCWVANMKTKQKKKTLSEAEIDAYVIAKADTESAWSKPVKVRKGKAVAVSLPSLLAVRAAFFAGLKRELVSSGRKSRS